MTWISVLCFALATLCLLAACFLLVGDVRRLDVGGRDGR